MRNLVKKRYLDFVCTLYYVIYDFDMLCVTLVQEKNHIFLQHLVFCEHHKSTYSFRY